MFVPRFLQFEGYETRDYQASTRDQVVYVDLVPRDDKPFVCHRCDSPLEGERGRHRLVLRDLPLRGFQTLVRLWRRKGHCPGCKKARSERVGFLAKESPHFTQDYAWWLGTMCEFAPVSRVAEMVSEGNMTVRRIDLKRCRHRQRRRRCRCCRRHRFCVAVVFVRLQHSQSYLFCSHKTLLISFLC